MSARTISSLLLMGLGFSLVLIVSRLPEEADEPNTEVERLDPPVDRGRDIEGGYYTLANGGPLYAGTVLSGTVTRFEGGGGAGLRPDRGGHLPLPGRADGGWPPRAGADAGLLVAGQQQRHRGP